MRIAFARLTHRLFGWRWAAFRYGYGILIRKVTNMGGVDMVKPYGDWQKLEHQTSHWFVYGKGADHE
jgi:hypothetical protein